MHLYAKNMHKICTYIDSISQICKRYAPNMPTMPKYAYYMPFYVINMQLYAQPNMQLYRLY